MRFSGDDRWESRQAIGKSPGSGTGQFVIFSVEWIMRRKRAEPVV